MSVFIDIKYAFRLLFESPKFTAMTLAVLVGGLTISLFTYSFLYAMIYKPLPIPEAQTAKALRIDIGHDYNLISEHEYLTIKDNITSLAEFGIYDNQNIRLSINDTGKSLSGSTVQAGFFEFSRTQPLMGRTIQAFDQEAGATPVAVISYETWQNELNASTDVLNQTIELNGAITHIIGVMPEGYYFPNTSRIWLPLMDTAIGTTGNHNEYYYAYARVKNEVSQKQAEKELGQAVNQAYQEVVTLFDLPERQKAVKLMSFQSAQTNGQGGVVFAFLNAVSWLILMLACINVGNLLLARAIERQKETAIRAALGAKTSRLVSQLMWEGIIICVIGGILSLLLVGAALDFTEVAFHSWVPGGGSFWWHWGMDLRTVTIGVAFTLVTILLSSFLPAWRSANQDINATLRDGTRGAQSKKAGRLSKFLVTTQIFLVALLMLIGSVSGFIAQKFINIEMGDDYTDLMTARITIPVNKYPESNQQLALIDTLKSQVAQHPQVKSVVSMSWRAGSPVALEGVDYPTEDSKPKIDAITVIGDTKTVGIKLVSGRQLDHTDKLGSRYTALISQSMAKRYWPSESPLEKSFDITIDGLTEKVFVVGVVSNRLNPSTMFGKLDSGDEIYVSGRQFVNNYHIVYYKIDTHTPSPEEIFYQAMFNTDRNIEMFYSVQAASKNRNLMRESMQLMSDITFGTGFFALLLAMVGIYGLTANSVAQRTHEVGIRRAVGASDKDIIQMFLKQGARQLIIGLGLALVLFALLSFGFHSFTEGMFPTYSYPMLALSVVVGLSAIVLFAIYTPTKRAVKMEPSNALRYE